MLTKRKKLQILRKMLTLVSVPGYYCGLCVTWARVDGDSFWDGGNELEDLLGMEKPKRATAYWWPRTERGNESRKRALRTAIKKLS